MQKQQERAFHPIKVFVTAATPSKLAFCVAVLCV